MASEKLFADRARTDQGAARYGESHYAYMDRTARLEFERARQTLETWFRTFPSEHRGDIRGRIISGNDRHFQSATFELYLHALLTATGADIQVHPPVPNSSSRPDFRVVPQSGEPYYLEATVATDVTDAQAAAQARINAVYDAVDRFASPNFFIGVRHKGEPTSPVPASRIRSFLEEQLAKLDPDDYADWAAQSIGFDALPHWPFSFDGWEVEFFPIPKAPEHRGGDDARPLGMFMQSEAKWVDNRTPLREAIVEKATRYGTLDGPYVVAVNALGWPLRRRTAMEALFGREQVVISRVGRDQETHFERASDGAWTSQGGPRHRRVSAVLFGSQIYPWSVAIADVCIYHNPWATLPLRDQLDMLSCAKANDTDMEWTDGVHPGVLLGLPERRQE